MNANYLSRKNRSMNARLEVNRELCAFCEERREYFEKIAETVQSESKETETTVCDDQVTEALSKANEFATVTIQLLEEQTKILQEFERMQRATYKYLKSRVNDTKISK